MTKSNKPTKDQTYEIETINYATYLKAKTKIIETKYMMDLIKHHKNKYRNYIG